MHSVQCTNKIHVIFVLLKSLSIQYRAPINNFSSYARYSLSCILEMILDISWKKILATVRFEFAWDGMVYVRGKWTLMLQ
jgi:hypothetical protein